MTTDIFGESDNSWRTICVRYIQGEISGFQCSTCAPDRSLVIVICLVCIGVALTVHMLVMCLNELSHSSYRYRANQMICLALLVSYSLEMAQYNRTTTSLFFDAFAYFFVAIYSPLYNDTNQYRRPLSIYSVFFRLLICFGPATLCAGSVNPGQRSLLYVLSNILPWIHLVLLNSISVLNPELTSSQSSTSTSPPPPPPPYNIACMSLNSMIGVALNMFMAIDYQASIKTPDPSCPVPGILFFYNVANRILVVLSAAFSLILYTHDQDDQSEGRLTPVSSVNNDVGANNVVIVSNQD